MSKWFDTGPYLKAAEARREAVAARCDEDSYTPTALKTAEISHFPGSKAGEMERVAEIADVAAPLSYPYPWSEGLAALSAMPQPEWRTEGQWRLLLDDCRRLDRNWGRIAHALGWSTCDLFGSPANPYAPAVGQMGLALLLDGREVLALTSNTATIANRRGPPNTFHLYPWRRAGVPVWIAYSPTAGP